MEIKEKEKEKRMKRKMFLNVKVFIWRIVLKFQFERVSWVENVKFFTVGVGFNILLYIVCLDGENPKNKK